MSRSAHPTRVRLKYAALAAFAGVILPSARAQSNYATPYYFTTLAGSGTAGFANGTGTAASFSFPTGVAVDAAGNVFVVDSNNAQVRKIRPTGEVTTFAPLGSGQSRGIAIDQSGNLYIGGYTSQTIRKITPAGVVTTLAGVEGAAGNNDGVGSAARFNLPLGLAVDATGNVFVADYGDHTIRKITPAGLVSTLAGLSNVPGTTDGTGAAARFSFPHGIGVDGSGNLYVADTLNHTIRKVTPAGIVTTFAGSAGVRATVDGTGTAARFDLPNALALDSAGNIYVGSFNTVRKITPAGVVTTLAGNPDIGGSSDGLGAAARFAGAFGVAVDIKGNLYVGDSNNHKIRRSVFPPAIAAAASPPPVNVGANVTFTADATSDYSVSFQWRKNGTPIAGATNATLVLSNVQVADAAVYSFTASNIAGSTTGGDRVLVINVPVSFVTQPVSETVVRGSTVQFGVAVSPAVGPTFQWRKDGAQISGATNATFTLTNVTASDAAQYSVAVRNGVFISASQAATLTVVDPPSVTAPPSQTVNAGTTVQLVASVNPPIGNLQWRKDYVVIPGATNATLTLANVAAADAGIYEISVSVGTYSASASMFLMVNVPPTITTQPFSQTATLGQPAQFTVAVNPASGSTFQWRKNGVAISGATNATFAISSVATGDAGTYSVVAARNGLSVTSNNATLTVEVPVTSQPVTQTVFVGSQVHFNFTATPPPGTTFQWRKDGVSITGATNANFSIPSATLADAGDYNVVFTLGGVVQTSNTATLVVLPLPAPVITTQPASRTVLVGTTVQFRVEASSPVALGFQWRRNGTSIAGATNDILTLSNVQLADSATYSVVVSNTAGSITSNNATLTVNAPQGTAPSINTHPAAQTVNAGATIVLSVSVTGTAPLSFQWYRNGAAIPGATASLLSIPNSQTADEANYSVVVDNSAGVATSNPALIRVIAPPVITAQPAAQSVTAGADVLLAVTATGTAPLTFQWRRDGTTLPGATSPTLLLGPVQLTDAGGYTVVVTNSAGSVTSAAATLNVAPPGPSSRLSNVSIRTTLAAGQTVIVGIAVDGGTRDVLVRAIGPSLSAFGVGTAMADPRVELFRGQSLVFANDDWPAALAPTFANAGAFGLALGSRDAAFVQNLNGAFSILTRGTGAGAVLVEAYDVGTGNTPRLVNVSARNRVGTGDDILIAGFNVTGTGTKQVLIRAVGPGLAGFGVPGTLFDPRLDLFNSSGVRLGENDDWPAVLAPTFSSVGAFALNNGSRDAALLTTLPIGSYTVQVRGADGGTGEAIVEVYEVP